MTEDERANLTIGDTVYTVMGVGDVGPYRRQWQACRYLGTEPILTMPDGTPRDLAWLDPIFEDQRSRQPEAIVSGVPWPQVFLEPGELPEDDGE